MSIAISSNNTTNNNNIIQTNQDRPLLILQSQQPLDQRGRGSMRTLLDLLTVDKMDGVDEQEIHLNNNNNINNSNINSNDNSNSNGNSSKWRVLKERVGLRIVGCCGVDTWRFGSSPEFLGDVLDHDHDHDDIRNDIVLVEVSRERNEDILIGAGQERSDFTIETHTNLATALAAERDYRAINSEANNGDATPSRVSLMRLLEETAEGGGFEGGDKVVEEEEVEVVESDRVCCVCMGRKKGAALIPCGHTYCRVCSRQVWLNRGSCPLCNQPILEILDIF